MTGPLDLQSFIDDEGALVIGEVGKQIAFPINRFFSISGVKAGGVRGGHAHKKLQQVLVCLSGSIEVSLHDGQRGWKELLDQPGRALHIGPMIWASQTYGGPDTVLLVLCDASYQESDYLRDFNEFCHAVENGTP